MSEECIFCHHDPYHYVDIGVGFQAAAVNCCDLGVALYQHGDEDLAKVANRIEALEETLRLRTTERNHANDIVDTYVDQVKALEAELSVAYAAGRVDGIQEAAIVARQALIDGAYIKRGSHQERPSSVMFLAETLVSSAIGNLIPAIAEIKGEQL